MLASLLLPIIITNILQIQVIETYQVLLLVKLNSIFLVEYLIARALVKTLHWHPQRTERTRTNLF
jgi:hypothetical protein